MVITILPRPFSTLNMVGLGERSFAEQVQGLLDSRAAEGVFPEVTRGILDKLLPRGEFPEGPVGDMAREATNGDLRCSPDGEVALMCATHAIIGQRAAVFGYLRERVIEAYERQMVKDGVDRYTAAQQLAEIRGDRPQLRVVR